MLGSSPFCRQRLALLIGLTPVAFACRPVPQDDIDYGLDWGHLPYVTTDRNKLIHADPDDKIEICGINPEVTIWAVLSWAQPIQRFERLKQNLVPCNSGGSGRKVLVEEINGGNKAPAWTAGSTVTINKDKIHNYNDNFFKAIMLHEIGHAWGLCDQYASVNNCHSGAGPKVNDAVMGSTHQGKLQLHNDDMIGIRELSERGDLPANSLWRTAGPVTTTPTIAAQTPASTIPGTTTGSTLPTNTVGQSMPPTNQAYSPLPQTGMNPMPIGGTGAPLQGDQLTMGYILQIIQQLFSGV